MKPNSAPPPINRPWDTIAPHGAAWGVTTFLAPGQSLLLVTGGTYYYSGSSSFPEDVNAYAYVDSINYATTYGNILESNENNNIFGPSITTAATGTAPVPAGSLRVAEGLPQR